MTQTPFHFLSRPLQHQSSAGVFETVCEVSLISSTLKALSHLRPNFRMEFEAKESFLIHTYEFSCLVHAF